MFNTVTIMKNFVYYLMLGTRLTWSRWWRRKSTRTSPSPWSLTCRHTWRVISFAKSVYKVCVEILSNTGQCVHLMQNPFNGYVGYFLLWFLWLKCFAFMDTYSQLLRMICNKTSRNLVGSWRERAVRQRSRQRGRCASPVRAHRRHGAHGHGRGWSLLQYYPRQAELQRSRPEQVVLLQRRRRQVVRSVADRTGVLRRRDDEQNLRFRHRQVHGLLLRTSEYMYHIFRSDIYEVQSLILSNQLYRQYR